MADSVNLFVASYALAVGIFSISSTRYSPTQTQFCFTRCSSPAWWPSAERQDPIPSRTRPSNAPAPMVLCLKTWESRSLPGLQNAIVVLFLLISKKPSRRAGAFFVLDDSARHFSASSWRRDVSADCLASAGIYNPTRTSADNDPRRFGMGRKP